MTPPLTQLVHNADAPCGSLMQVLDSHHPLAAGVARQALVLVRALAFDWHLIKAKERGKLAAALCGVLASALGPRSGVLASALRPRSGSQEAPTLKCGHVWALIDPSMTWWQRLLSGRGRVIVSRTPGFIQMCV